MWAINQDQVADQGRMARGQYQRDPRTPTMSDKRNLTQSQSGHAMNRIFRECHKVVAAIWLLALPMTPLIKGDHMMLRAKMPGDQSPGIGSRAQAVKHHNRYVITILVSRRVSSGLYTL